MIQVTETVQTPPAAAPPRPANSLGAGLFLAWLAMGFALQRLSAPPGLLTFAFVMLGWVLSVMAHEFSHAAVAWLGGDVTVADKGYLSFDPRRYGDQHDIGKYRLLDAEAAAGVPRRPQPKSVARDLQRPRHDRM